jgi:diguanylate cyclase (GGDEF)-like protein/PAS domain S-box-containing protein
VTDPLAATAGDLADAFLTSTGAMVVIVDGGGRIRLVNPALERFTGLPARDVIGRPFWDVYVVPGDIVPAQKAVALAMSTGSASAVEADWVAAGGVRRRVAMHNSVLREPDGRPGAIACVAIDVTEVHRRGTTDALTGVLNRAGLFETLGQHLDAGHGPGCGVLFCDLDDFKGVNDAHGHAVGDALLVEVARRLRQVTRPADGIARIGGDEFILLCPAADDAALAALADRVADRLREPLTTPAGPISIRASIGAAVGRPGEDPDDVLARADTAMYRIKHRGPGRRTSPSPRRDRRRS